MSYSRRKGSRSPRRARIPTTKYRPSDGGFTPTECRGTWSRSPATASRRTGPSHRCRNSSWSRPQSIRGTRRSAQTIVVGQRLAPLTVTASGPAGALPGAPFSVVADPSVAATLHWTQAFGPPVSLGDDTASTLDLTMPDDVVLVGARTGARRHRVGAGDDPTLRAGSRSRCLLCRRARRAGRVAGEPVGREECERIGDGRRRRRSTDRHHVDTDLGVLDAHAERPHAELHGTEPEHGRGRRGVRPTVVGETVAANAHAIVVGTGGGVCPGVTVDLSDFPGIARRGPASP